MHSFPYLILLYVSIIHLNLCAPPFDYNVGIALLRLRFFDKFI